MLVERVLLFRVCRGIPRIASRLLRAALKEAHARNQNVVDDSALKAAVETLTLTDEVKPFQGNRHPPFAMHGALTSGRESATAMDFVYF